MLHEIQAKIKAPKNQKNNFGGYKYRSCEDIVEAAKPILKEYGLALVLTDDVVPVGSRIYVKATAALWKDSTNGSPLYSATGWAREEETKKGMDAAQITGSASSYARKYALNGLFAIDDTKDADATNDHGHDVPEKQAAPVKSKEVLDENHPAWFAASQAVMSGKYTIDQIKQKYSITQRVEKSLLGLRNEKEAAA